MTTSRARVHIRALAGWDELNACVRLQQATWGEAFRERAPASLLLVAQRTGGVVAGAFEDDALVGFVFGITGYVDGEPIHWSDMLAVLAGRRDRGIGEALKRFQREQLLGAGVRRMLWTADPLEARNAHLNLSRLGALADTYERDLYGRPDSPLHRGLGTDRLILDWRMDAERAVRALAGARPWPDMQSVGRLAALGDHQAAHGVLAPAGLELSLLEAANAAPLRLAVPSDIQALKERAPDVAMAWREHVRSALAAAFETGYAATALVRAGEVGWYVLQADYSSS